MKFSSGVLYEATCYIKRKDFYTLTEALQSPMSSINDLTSCFKNMIVKPDSPLLRPLWPIKTHDDVAKAQSIRLKQRKEPN